MTKVIDNLNIKLNKNKKIKKFLIFSILTVVFIFLFDLVIMPWYVYEAEVKVPNVVGKSKIEAERILNENNLNFEIISTHPDKKIPLNHVILQVPEPKAIVKEGRNIQIYISSGDPKVLMPELVMKSYRDAQLSIERLGLKVGTVTDIESDIEADYVVAQSIAPKKEVSEGEKVDLTISKGPKVKNTVVPNLFGKSFEEAKRILTQSSLVLGKVTSLSSPDLLPNTIMDQSPAPDKEVEEGSEVTLVIVKLNN